MTTDSGGMSSPFKALDDLTREEKDTIYILFALNMPVDVRDDEQMMDYDESTKSGEEKQSESWSAGTLRLIAGRMGVSAGHVNAYMPVVPKSYEAVTAESIKAKRENMQPFLQALDKYNTDRTSVLTQLLMILVLNGKFDARGRVAIRNLRETFRVPRADYLTLERLAAKHLMAYQEEITHMLKKDDTKKKYMRYAKIGVATLGAGAVLAVTGGLAAPAIAGAMVVMGSTTAAAAVSVTTMATLFGTAGAGLAGYKMMKRTQGISDFEFEQHDKKGQLAVVIMVSGWIEKPDDYRRAFGVLPDQLEIEEILKRFYLKNCPGRDPNEDFKRDVWSSQDPDALQEKIKAMFDLDITEERNLIPSYPALGASWTKPAGNVPISGDQSPAPTAGGYYYVDISPAQRAKRDRIEQSIQLCIDSHARAMFPKLHHKPGQTGEMVRNGLTKELDRSSSATTTTPAGVGKMSDPSGGPLSLSKPSGDADAKMRETADLQQGKDTEWGYLSDVDALSTGVPAGNGAGTEGGRGRSISIIASPTAGHHKEEQEAIEHMDEKAAAAFGIPESPPKSPNTSGNSVIDAVTGGEGLGMAAKRVNAGTAIAAAAAKVSADSGAVTMREKEGESNERTQSVVHGAAEGKTAREGMEGKRGDGQGFDEEEEEEEEEDGESYTNILAGKYWHWRELEMCPAYELYVLRWEQDLQMQLGSAVLQLLKSLSSTAVQKVLAATVLTAFLAAVAWPAFLIQLMNHIDDLWAIAMERADAAGVELAKALLKRPQGSRPVTLVGYSAGARVIFSCMKELARLERIFGDRDGQGGLENSVAGDALELVHSSAGEGVVGQENGDDIHKGHQNAHPDPQQQQQQQQQRSGSIAAGFMSAINPFGYMSGSKPAPTNSTDGSATTATATSATTTSTAVPPSASDISCTGSSDDKRVDASISRSSSTDKRTGGGGGRAPNTRKPSKNGAHAAPQPVAKAALQKIAKTENSGSRAGYLTNVIFGTGSTKASAEDEEEYKGVNWTGVKEIVQDVVLLGAPVSTSNTDDWNDIRGMVCGRLINGYSTKDMVLSIVFRYQRFQFTVSGISEVSNKACPGIENVNISHIVHKHSDYCQKMNEILRKVDLLGSAARPAPAPSPSAAAATAANAESAKAAAEVVWFDNN